MSKPFLPNYDLKDSNYKITIMQPEIYEDCYRIVDVIKNGQPVVVDFSKAETKVAHNIFDFITGAVFAINGRAEKIAGNTYLFVSSGTEIIIK